MSKQGVAAVRELERLIHQRVTIDSIENWIERLRRVNQMYCPERNVLQCVLALFGAGFNGKSRIEISNTMKTAKKELRVIVRGIKHSNGIK